jgi:capsular polysaccharide transport system permease protein
MSVEDEVEQRDGLQGVLDAARHTLPDIRRDAETIEPVAPSRLPEPLRRLAAPLRRPLRWLRLPGTTPEPRSMPRALLMSFLTFVAVPTAAMALYLFVFAADQYVVEARFAVRGGVEPLAGSHSLGEFGNLIAKNTNQDSFIVADYIRSQAMVAEVSKDLDLPTLFARPEADAYARFHGPKPIEELTRYWRSQVLVHVDSISGIITLEVRAFRPEDALAIAKSVVAAAERLVNDISRRAQADMVARNREDMEKATERMREAHIGLQQFRNRWGLIDPVKSAEAIYKTVMDLRKEKIKTENDLQVLRETLDEKSRSVQTLAATANALDQQITQLQTELTTEGAATNAKNVTEALVEYEARQTERTVADKLFESMHLLYQRARMAAERQQVYLATFQPPTIPHISLYPLRGYALFVAFALSFVLWSIAKLIVAGVKDHRF